MAIARGLTRRIKRTDASNPPPTRSQSVKNPGLHIDRSKISSPVALLSTTNMLSYNAPDIATLQHRSSSEVCSTPSTAPSTPPLAQSDDDSYISDSTSRSRSSSDVSQGTLTDASSVGSSPTSPKPNHLSAYFPTPSKGPRRSASSGNIQFPTTIQHRKSASLDVAPAIPERALSHSKRAHERLAQKRSMQSMYSQGSSVRSSRSNSLRDHRTSVDIFRGTISEESHPFGKELEQLNEVAEEFGGVVHDAQVEADLAAICEKGLAQFCVVDYLDEIGPLYSARFDIPCSPTTLAWI